MNWLRKLFHLCDHKWEVVEQYSVESNITGKQTSVLYVLRCVHCGDIKRRRV